MPERQPADPSDDELQQLRATASQAPLSMRQLLAESITASAFLADEQEMPNPNAEGASDA